MTKIESAFSGVMVCPGDILGGRPCCQLWHPFDGKAADLTFSSAMALCVFVAIAVWTR